MIIASARVLIGQRVTAGRCGAETCVCTQLQPKIQNSILVSRLLTCFVENHERQKLSILCEFDFENCEMCAYESVTTSGPRLVHQRLWYTLSCLRESAYIKDPLLLIGKNSLCGDSRFSLKNYVTIWLMSNRWWYENQCALETLLNVTNFPFLFVRIAKCCETNTYSSMWWQAWGHTKPPQTDGARNCHARTPPQPRDF